jgi:hypothetical protein
MTSLVFSIIGLYLWRKWEESTPAGDQFLVAVRINLSALNQTTNTTCLQMDEDEAVTEAKLYKDIAPLSLLIVGPETAKQVGLELAPESASSEDEEAELLPDDRSKLIWSVGKDKHGKSSTSRMKKKKKHHIHRPVDLESANGTLSSYKQ